MKVRLSLLFLGFAYNHGMRFTSAILFQCSVAGTGLLALLTAAPAAQAQAPGVPASLWGQASLYRDEWGVPHVFAETPLALGFAFGYAQAEDHLEPMLLAYRMANGRLAAVFGPAYAASDEFSLRMGHARVAEAAWPTVDPVTRDLCEGFALGVNAFLVDRPDKAPAWADGVQPKDILALWHAFLMSFAPLDLPGVYRNAPAMETGNCWALAPFRTEENKTTLVINPHHHFEGPFQWFEAHLVLGDLNVYGAALRGIPVVVQGFNGSLGWGLTPNFPDFADVYDEQSAPAGDPENPRDPRVSEEAPVSPEALMLLEYMAAAQPYYVRTENGLEERYVPAAASPRGPILEGAQGGLFSWRIGGYGLTGGIRQLVEMGRARNSAQFQAALGMAQLPCFHVVCADREGNLFYLYNTLTGLRKEIPPEIQAQMGVGPLLYDRPLPVGVDLLGWGELVAPDALPSILNPPSGWIQACGGPPWFAAADPPFGPQSWPAWLARDTESYRGRRVRQLLGTGTRSFRDNQSMLYDTVVPAAMDAVPLLLGVAEKRPDLVQSAHPDLAAALDLLRGWNFTADAGSTGMTFYHVFWAMLRGRAGAAVAGDSALYAWLGSGVPEAQDAMIRAAGDAARVLQNEFQTLSVPWGDVHALVRGTREVPAPGAATGEPVFLLSDSSYENGKWRAAYGTGPAIAVQFGETPEAVSFSPFGSSEDPSSPHYADQMDLLLERRFKPVRYATESVLRYAESGTGLRVTLLPPGVTGSLTFSGAAPIRARVAVQVEAPEALPAGSAAFSLHMLPERVPKGVPTAVDLVVQLPPEMCPDAELGRLSLFALEEGTGWYPVPSQERDPANRVFRGRHDAPAKAYALLGPLELLPPAPATADGAAPALPSGVPLGLDVLIGENPVLQGNGARRVFKFERHDAAGQEGDETDADTEAGASTGERVFKIEKLDDTKHTGDVLPVPEVPGFQFGPGARKSDEERAQRKDSRVFRLERLDKVELPNEEGVSSGEEAAPAPPALETPEVSPGAPGPESAAAPPADTEEKAVPEGAAVDGVPEAATIPEVVPVDPNFNFGPAYKKPGEAAGEGGGRRVFKMERNPKPEE